MHTNSKNLNDGKAFQLDVKRWFEDHMTCFAISLAGRMKNETQRITYFCRYETN